MIKVKLIFRAFLFFLIPLFCRAQNFGGNVPSIKWEQINTSMVRVIFPGGLDSQANRIANVMMLLDSTTINTIGGHPRKWNIVLQNQTTIPNAYVRMAPIMSELFMTPPQDNFSTGSIRWDDNLIIHENRHIQQFSNFNKGITKLFSFFLGQEGQLFANGLFLPDYFFEGDAVWQETLVSGQGRGRMPSFFNGYKSLWLDNKNYHWSKFRSGSLKDFVPDYYQTGYLLTAYGYQKYGQGFWKKVTEDAVRLKRFFNKAIEKHSGVPFKQFRTDAINFFKQQSMEKQKVDVPLQFVSGVKKNNVIDYLFPHFIGNDSILVTKKSLKEVNTFYLLANNKEEKLRIKNVALDDYFSNNRNTIVYASYQSDARWANRDYSVIQLVDIKTKKQKQLTFKSKYFSPDINMQGSEIIAVRVNTDGSNNLVRLNAITGEVMQVIPNIENYFFTQTRYINNEAVITAARNANGKMALVKINFSNCVAESVTPFSFNVLGYPQVIGDTVFFNMMNNKADKIFAVTLSTNKIYRLTNNNNGIYSPAVNAKGDIIFSAFSAHGQRLAKASLQECLWENFSTEDFKAIPDLFLQKGLKDKGANAISTLQEKQNPVTPYKKSFHLFNFHSWRAVVEDPEYGYSFFSDNVLSSFSNILTYTYNRNDKSHTLKYNTAFAGWFPVLNVSAEESFNRTVDTAFGKSVQFNSATVKTGFSIPLSFVGGRTSKFLNFGAGYNVEQYYYKGVGKNVFSNKAINYANAFLSFSNVNRTARQHIHPRWAQSFSFNYKDAFTYRDSHKFNGSASFYFPGLGINHSLVFNVSYQKRDTLPDLFSNTFSYARGYQALSTRQMYKVGANYHFPLFYPDGGINGLIYFLRIRANVFFDYNNARARVNRVLTDILNRSVGGELYFDTKVWNSLPVNFGIRFSHLLDTDLINTGVKNKWEFIVPIGLIPN
jgi:hypothetical protein